MAPAKESASPGILVVKCMLWPTTWHRAATIPEAEMAKLEQLKAESAPDIERTAQFLRLAATRLLSVPRDLTGT